MDKKKREPTINVRAKGQRAERDIVRALQPVVIDEWRKAGRTGPAPSLERNLMQSHKGGHDIVGLDWLAIEVKHQERFLVSPWWAQTKRQAADSEIRTGVKADPVLCYRKNNVLWKVRLFGYVDTKNSGRVRCPVEIDFPTFLLWFAVRLREELADQK